MVSSEKKPIKCNESKSGGRKSSLDKLREHLRTLGSDDLFDIVIDEAKDNNDFRNRLLERFTAAGMMWDFADLRRTITDMLRFNGFIEYRQSNQYGFKIQQAGMILKSIMFHGHASEALDIIEFIIPKLEKAIGHADDSNGSIGGAIAMIAELRIEACQAASPDQVKLANKLYTYDIDSPWEWFGNFDGRYDAALGETGKARYAELVRGEWEKLPDLSVGDSDYSSKRFALQTAMERIAKESGNIESRLAAARKDLSMPSGYLKVAGLLRDAGRDDEALAWAEKGVRDFSGSSNEGYFAHFLADAYHRRGRDDDAIEIYWQRFLARPSLAEYESLRRQSELANLWPRWHDRAMEHLHRQIDDADENTPYGKASRIGRNGVLVEVLLFEKRYDEAWKQAQLHGCPFPVMRNLMKIWEPDHPSDCIPVCKLFCENALVRADSRAYSEAAGELLHLGEVMARAGMKEDFSLYMQGVRSKYKARKNLMIELDRHGLP